MEKPSIYKPEFIPFYPEVKKKYNLTDKETLLYGFIRFYISTSPNKKFYFSNKQLGEILGLKEIATSRLVNSLAEKCPEIKIEYDIKSGGGKVRLIQWYNSDLYKCISQSYTNVYVNNNKINNNKKNVFLSKDKKALEPKTLKKEYGNKLVNYVLEEFKKVKGFYPTDKKPRQRAWNLIQKVNSFFKKYPNLPEKINTPEKFIKVYFEFLKKKDYFQYIETIDAVVRKAEIFFGKVEKWLKREQVLKKMEEKEKGQINKERILELEKKKQELLKKIAVDKV